MGGLVDVGDADFRGDDADLSEQFEASRARRGEDQPI
jgi:hypothetical protein